MSVPSPFHSPWLTPTVRPTVVPVHDATAVGEARRLATAMAADLGFDQTAAGRVAIVVTEAANNVVKHAGTAGGQVVLQPGSEPGLLEILLLDSGPGMEDVARCLRDGYSTGGTSGTGLGALSRLANEFDLYSSPSTGTAVLGRLRATEPGAPPPVRPAAVAATPSVSVAVGGVSVPKPGETACGDAWAFHQYGTRTWLMVADGLGHGPIAREAAEEAVRVFRQNIDRVVGGGAGTGTPPGALLGTSSFSIEDLLREMHGPLRKTRGAAVSIAEVDHARRALGFAGVGNVAGVVVSPDGTPRSMVSHNGTLGAEARKFQQFVYPWPPGSTLVLHSDGLQSNLRIEKYPGLLSRHPTLVAGVLYRDFSRRRDDATAVVLREHEPKV